MLMREQSFTQSAEFKYQIYKMDSRNHYRGESYLSAASDNEAEKIFNDFWKNDTHNEEDSRGHDSPEPTGMYTNELFFDKKICYIG